MKTYDQLSEDEKTRAIEASTNRLLSAICEGVLRFNDELNGDDLQARIDGAFAKAEKMRTPWFASAYVMEAARDEIEGMARFDAEDALYPEPHERIINGVAS